MKRVTAILLLLLLLLPMQIVWAGMQGYWPQEKASSEHPGHHVHADSQAQDETGPAAGSAFAGDDADCDYCHHSFCSPVSVTHRFAGSPSGLDLPATKAARYHSFIADITHPPDI